MKRIFFPHWFLFLAVLLGFSFSYDSSSFEKSWSRDIRMSSHQVEALLEGNLRPIIDQIKRSLPLDRELKGFKEKVLLPLRESSGPSAGQNYREMSLSIPENFSKCLTNQELEKMNSKETASTLRLQCTTRDGFSAVQVVEWQELAPGTLKDDKRFLTWRQGLFLNENLPLDSVKFLKAKRNSAEYLESFIKPYCKPLAKAYNVWPVFSGQSNCRSSFVVRDAVELKSAGEAAAKGNLFVHEIFIAKSHGSIMAFRVWFAGESAPNGASELPQISRYYVFLPLVALHSLKVK